MQARWKALLFGGITSSKAFFCDVVFLFDFDVQGTRDIRDNPSQDSDREEHEVLEHNDESQSRCRHKKELAAESVGLLWLTITFVSGISI